jgi:hypothetical protein
VVKHLPGMVVVSGLTPNTANKTKKKKKYKKEKKITKNNYPILKRISKVFLLVA